MPTLETSVAAMDVREFKTFRELIHRKTGIWLRDGKQSMLAGRLSKRLRHHGMTDFATYAAYVTASRMVEKNWERSSTALPPTRPLFLRNAPLRFSDANVGA